MARRSAPPRREEAEAPSRPGLLRTLWRSRLVRAFTVLVALTAVVAILLLLVFPTQALLDQRQRIDDAEATLAALRSESSGLEDRVAAGTDPIIVERVAREQLSLVREGDILYRLSVDPANAVDLPASWPLPGVRHLLTGE